MNQIINCIVILLFNLYSFIKKKIGKKKKNFKKYKKLINGMDRKVYDVEIECKKEEGPQHNIT